MLKIFELGGKYKACYIIFINYYRIKLGMNSNISWQERSNQKTFDRFMDVNDVDRL